MGSRKDFHTGSPKDFHLGPQKNFHSGICFSPWASRDNTVLSYQLRLHLDSMCTVTVFCNIGMGHSNSGYCLLGVWGSTQCSAIQLHTLAGGWGTSSCSPRDDLLEVMVGDRFCLQEIGVGGFASHRGILTLQFLAPHPFSLF